MTWAVISLKLLINMATSSIQYTFCFDGFVNDQTILLTNKQ